MNRTLPLFRRNLAAICARPIWHPNNTRADQPDEVLSKFPSPWGFAVPIATVAQGGTVADEVSGCDDVRGRTRARRDRGFSLIEVVVTITLMAVVLVPTARR